jgi:hypothetical protein
MSKREPEQLIEAKPLWERQPVETQKAYAAFLVYLNLTDSERTLAATAAALGRRPGYKSMLKDWASRWCWRKRLDAWQGHRDAEILAAKLEGNKREAIEMGPRQADEAKAIARALLEPARILLAKLQAGGDSYTKTLKDMTIDELLAIVQRCGQVWPHLMKAERLARGEPTELIRGEIDINLVTNLAMRMARLTTKYIPDQANREKLQAEVEQLLVEVLPSE